MTLASYDKKTLSEVRFEKARAALADARANLAEERLSTAANRSYYAALNAVRALLILEGVNPESNVEAVTMLWLRFILTKLLPVTVSKDFKMLLTRKADVDYGDFEAISRSEAADSVRRAERLLDRIDQLRKRLAADL